MNLRCRCCGSTFSGVGERAKKEDFKELKMFLGPWLGKGLTEDEMPNTWVVKADRKIIASLITIPCSHLIWYFNRLKVARAFRRQGLAIYLLINAFSGVKKENIHKGLVLIYAVTLGKGPSELVQSLGAAKTTKTLMLSRVHREWIARYGKQHKYWSWSI